jgi:hypothetical protein
MDKRPSMERRGMDLSKERDREERSDWLDNAIKTNPEFAKRYYPEQYELYHGGGGGGGGRGGRGRRGKKRRTRPKRPGPIDRLLRRARRAKRKIEEKVRGVGRKLREGFRFGHPRKDYSQPEVESEEVPHKAQVRDPVNGRLKNEIHTKGKRGRSGLPHTHDFEVHQAPGGGPGRTVRREGRPTTPEDVFDWLEGGQQTGSGGGR